MAPNGLVTPHQYPGTLIVVEGIDWSGTTTQLDLLAKWLDAAGHRVVVTELEGTTVVSQSRQCPGRWYTATTNGALG